MLVYTFEWICALLQYLATPPVMVVESSNHLSFTNVIVFEINMLTDATKRCLDYKNLFRPIKYIALW